MAKIVLVVQKSLSWDAVFERGRGNKSLSLGKARVQKEENERPQKEPGEGRVAGQSLTEGGGGQEGQYNSDRVVGVGGLLALLMGLGGGEEGLCCHQLSRGNELGEGSKKPGAWLK